MEPTPRTTVRRKPDRARYDDDTIFAILDEGLVAHVGFVAGDHPVVLPMAYSRIDRALYLHGATGNHLLRSLASGAEACATVTLLDGLVLARSAFHHSMNYRSAVVIGPASRVYDRDEQRAALDALVEHVVPGRSAQTRPPTDRELRATLVVRVPIDEASAKVRTGGPIEEPEDHDLPWAAGVVPLTLTRGPLLPDR
jgi:hypothetical protein